MMLQLDATIYTPIIVYKFITIINIINISNDDEKYLHSLLRNDRNETKRERRHEKQLSTINKKN